MLLRQSSKFHNIFIFINRTVSLIPIWLVETYFLTKNILENYVQAEPSAYIKTGLKEDFIKPTT